VSNALVSSFFTSITSSGPKDKKFIRSFIVSMLASKLGTVVTRGMFDGRYIGDNVINLPQTSVVNLSHKAMEAGITAAANNQNVAQAMVASGLGSGISCVAAASGVIFKVEEGVKQANFATNVGEAVVKEMVANGSNNIGQALGRQVAESTGTWAGAKVVQVISSLNSSEADNVKSKPADILHYLEQQAARDELLNQIDDRYNSQPSRKQIFSYNSNHPAFDELPRTYNYRNADFDHNYWEHEDYLPAEQQNNAPGLDAEFTNVAFNQHLRGMQSWGTDSFNSYEGLPHIYSHAYMDANINASRKIFSLAQPLNFQNYAYDDLSFKKGVMFSIPSSSYSNNNLMPESSQFEWHFQDTDFYERPISEADLYLFSGAGRGFIEIWQGSKQLGLQLGEKIGLVSNEEIFQYTSEINDEKVLYENTAAGKSMAGKLGKFSATALVYSIPVGSGLRAYKLISANAAVGGLIAATQPIYEYENVSWNSRGKDILWGAAVGAVVVPATNRLAACAAWSYYSIKGGGFIRRINPSSIKFSQSSVNEWGDVVESMQKHGWKYTKKPIDVVRLKDNTLLTMDNTRVLAADSSKIKVRAIVRDFDKVFPETMSHRLGGDYKKSITWGEAVMSRIKKQNKAYREKYPEGSMVIGLGKKYEF
jgi:hypothetical protein